MAGQTFKEKKESAVRLVADGAALVDADEPSTSAAEPHINEPRPEVPSAEVAGSEKSCGEEPAAKAQLNPTEFPDLGERYEVIEQIGAGGMGTVWKVHDRTLDQTLAIKLLHPEMLKDATVVKRFEQEAKLATDLTHVNIASIYGLDTDKAGHPFIIMNFVDGESLADVLSREGKLDQERAMDIFRQICAALTHSHMKGVIHRDIKPSNIIISKTPSGADLVHVVDFGIAKSIYGDLQSTQALTRTEDICGSPLYMSPEQCLGEEVTEQSDIYSLGCVLYEMLTGGPPFKEKNPVKLVLQHLHDKPDFSHVPPNLWALVYICLQKEKRARPESIEDLLVYCTGRKIHRDFNGTPFSEKWLGLMPAMVLLIGLPTVSSHSNDAADGFFNFVFMWLIFSPFWLALAVANVNTIIRSNIVRMLEQALFVVGFLMPFLALFNCATKNSYEVVADVTAVGLFAVSMKLLTKGDLYGRMFFWRHPKSMAHQAESGMFHTFRAVFRILAFAILVVAALYLGVVVKVWMTVGDLVPLAEIVRQVGVFPFILPVLSLFVWYCADPSFDGEYSGVHLQKSFWKSLRICSALYFGMLVSCGISISFVWDASCTSWLRQQLAFGLVDGPAVLKVQSEALGAPRTVLGDFARTWAVSGLLRRQDQNVLARQISEQVLANDVDPSSMNKATSYVQLAELTARTTGWKAASTYFDKAIEQLKKSDSVPRWRDPKAMIAYDIWPTARGELALRLAQLAASNSDIGKLKQAMDFIADSHLDLIEPDSAKVHSLKKELGITLLEH